MMYYVLQNKFYTPTLKPTAIHFEIDCFMCSICGFCNEICQDGWMTIASRQQFTFPRE